MTPSFCRSCGRQIVWAETSHGKKVPLDPKALVFSVMNDKGKLIAVKPSGGPIGEQFMVSHFATCPDANKWSGQHREETTPESKTPFTMAPERHFSEPKEIA